MKLRSTTIAAAVALATALTAVGSVDAAPPIKLPPAGNVSIFVPSTPCGGFQLDIVDQSTARIFTRPDGTQIIHSAGQLSGVLTSVVTGRSLSLDFSGPVWITPTQTVLTGGTLLFDPTRLELVHGRTVVPADPAAATQIVGNRVDLCVVLNPT